MKLTSLLLFVLLCPAAHVFGQDLRLGIIGTDTSHVIAFTKTLNDANDPHHIAGAHVAVAFKGGSPDVEESSSRVEKYASELQQKYGVKLVGKIPEMCDAVDGILLESLDGRVHLAQVKEAVQCHKPMFIDKPFASTLADAKAIVRIASEAKVPWFSASSLRFSDIETLKQKPVKGVIVWGPGPTEAHQPLDLTWYGIHAADMLYTLMGEGCATVSRITSPDADVVTCRWKDGRLGTMRVDRPYNKFGVAVFRPQNQTDALNDIKVDYVPLVRQIVKFMQTKEPPFPNSQTLEVIQMLDAAQKSGKQGGKPVAM